MSENTALRLEKVRTGYGDRTILHDVDLAIERNRITALIGPNGCGKTTLLRTMGRLVTPVSGRVLIDESPASRLGTKEIARRLAILPQAPIAPEGMTVADLAARGRQPHQPWYRQWSPEDERIVAEALRATNMTELVERPLDELSGGQRQRAWIAMILAQATPYVLLDEPTTHLDLAHAVDVLDLVVRLRRDQGKTVVMVVHDLALAARYSDHIVVMKEGTIVTQGSPKEVIDAMMLKEVFGLSAHVFEDPVDGLPTVVPTGHL